jgi:hypothetical protein
MLICLRPRCAESPPDRYKLAVFQNKPFADRLWARLQHSIAPALAPFIMRCMCGEPLGLNPRLRVLRYDDEDQFEAHYDRVVPEDDGSRSLITVLIYLNSGGGEDFSGGETLFLDSKEPDSSPVAVVPKVRAPCPVRSARRRVHRMPQHAPCIACCKRCHACKCG